MSQLTRQPMRCPRSRGFAHLGAQAR